MRLGGGGPPVGTARLDLLFELYSSSEEGDDDIRYF